MSKYLLLALFLLLFFALDFYVFQGFKLLIKKWLPAYANWFHILYWAIPLGLILFLVLYSLFSESTAKNIIQMWTGSVLFGLFIAKVFWLVFMLLDDVVRLVKYSGTSSSSAEGTVNAISRSEFIVTSGALVAGTVFGTLLYGILKGAHNYQVHNKTLKLKN
jgi:hypothetical protein